MTRPRYAVYLAPALASPWWTAGSAWLGRCARTGALLPQPAVAGLSAARLQEHTAAPRRYGWHATLRAPFHLADGVSIGTLEAAVADLAGQLAPFPVPALQVVRLADFLALTLTTPCAALQALADACVRDLQPFATHLDAAELQRRCPPGTPAAVQQRVATWGYAHVFADFRFHLTLSGPLTGLAPAVVDALRLGAAQHFADLPPLACTALTLFEEPAPGAAFRVRTDFPLRG